MATFARGSDEKMARSSTKSGSQDPGGRNPAPGACAPHDPRCACGRLVNGSPAFAQLEAVPARDSAQYGGNPAPDMSHRKGVSGDEQDRVRMSRRDVNRKRWRT